MTSGRHAALALSLVIGLAAPQWFLAGQPAGAVTERPGPASCQTFNEMTTIPYNVTSFQFGGCTDGSNTGGSGTGVLTESSSEGQSVLITWSTGGTTSLFLNTPTTKVSDWKRCPFAFGTREPFAYKLTGYVVADSTGSIKVLRPVDTVLCFDTLEVASIETNRPGSIFRF